MTPLIIFINKSDRNEDDSIMYNNQVHNIIHHNILNKLFKLNNDMTGKFTSLRNSSSLAFLKFQSLSFRKNYLKWIYSHFSDSIMGRERIWHNESLIFIKWAYYFNRSHHYLKIIDIRPQVNSTDFRACLRMMGFYVSKDRISFNLGKALKAEYHEHNIKVALFKFENDEGQLLSYIIQKAFKLYIPDADFKFSNTKIDFKTAVACLFYQSKNKLRRQDQSLENDDKLSTEASDIDDDLSSSSLQSVKSYRTPIVIYPNTSFSLRNSDSLNSLGKNLKSRYKSSDKQYKVKSTVNDIYKQSFSTSESKKPLQNANSTITSTVSNIKSLKSIYQLPNDFASNKSLSVSLSSSRELSKQSDFNERIIQEGARSFIPDKFLDEQLLKNIFQNQAILHLFNHGYQEARHGFIDKIVKHSDSDNVGSTISYKIGADDGNDFIKGAKLAKTKSIKDEQNIHGSASCKAGYNNYLSFIHKFLENNSQLKESQVTLGESLQLIIGYMIKN